MKFLNGLYVSLVLMMFVILTNTTVFKDEYSGIAMFISLGIFIIGTGFYVSAKQLKANDKE